MRNRKDLHDVLQEALGEECKCNLYYQPPTSVKMCYPCIRYQRTHILNRYADNAPYAQGHSYEVIVIDKNPDSPIVKRVSLLPQCRHDRHYTADQLNHDVFTIFY